MAKVVQTTLQISEANVEQYCTADGLSLNTGGYAIRLYLNGHTQGSAILNNAAKEVLYPSATAHPFKIDSTIRANKSGGSMTISLQFDGTSVQSETGDWGSGLKNKTKEGISDPVVINSNRSTEIKWHIKGSSTVSRFSIASTKLTFYFNQYEMRPLVGNNANGIQKVTVSNASPCYGDTVVFTPKLVQGATWAGWYSDAACTNLVSADQNYSVSPSSDITLYAKATIDANLYNVSAVAGAEITSASVSDNVVPEGGTATFTAQFNTGCSFEAWYSDDTYTTVVSTENPYTATITADTTLYAKAHRNSLNMSVGSAEHGTASISATTVPYDSDVTFTFTPEDETWELYGWYSDSALTQLVSEANPYTFTATEDATLYPKIGKKRYTITLSFKEFDFLGVGKLAVVDFDSLTEEEIGFLKDGNYDAIDADKVYDTSSVKPDASVISKTYTVSIRCPMGLYVAMYLQNYNYLGTKYYRYIDGYTWWPYYWYQPNQDASFIGLSDTNTNTGACNCTAIAKDNISSVDATTPVVATKEAIFTAKVNIGCSFVGWYSDEACTQLVSNSNPAYVVTPQGGFTSSGGSYREESSLTLYAKATKAIYTIGVGTAEHGSATVSKSTAYYGDTVTFNCTVDEGYEFKGWYSDEGLNQLVSESAEYVHSVTGNVTLWAKVELIVYNLLLHPTGYDEINFLKETTISDVERLYVNDETSNTYSSLAIQTSTNDNPVSIGFYIDGSKFSNMPNNAVISDISVSIRMRRTPLILKVSETYISKIYTAKRNLTNEIVSYVRVGQNEYEGTRLSISTTNYSLTRDSVGSWTPTELRNGQFGIVLSEYCTYVPSDGSGIEDTEIYNINISVTYTLPGNDQATGSGISLKRNGSWLEAKSVYRKVNGAWVQQSNPKTLFSGSSTGNESNYIYCGDVSS